MYSKIYKRLSRTRDMKYPIILHLISSFIYVLLFFLVAFRYLITFIQNDKDKYLSEYESEKLLENLRKDPRQKRNTAIKNLEIINNIDLSIIIPVYNVEKFIEECLESILRQETHYIYEVIIINDGSTDNSLELINKFLDRKNIYLINQENQGLSVARNSGIDAAKGNYLMFVDSDDILIEGTIEKFLHEGIKGNYDIVEGKLKKFKEIGEINYISTYTGPYKEEKYKDNPDYILNCTGFACGKLYKRNLWSRIRFPENYLFEDTIIKYILLRQAKSYLFIPTYVYGYRYNSESLTRKIVGSSKSLDTLWIVKFLLEECKSIKIANDETLYKLTLNQLGKVMFSRIYNLDYETQKAALVISKRILISIRESRPTKMSFMNRALENSILSLNLKQWKLLSKYM